MNLLLKKINAYFLAGDAEKLESLFHFHLLPTNLTGHLQRNGAFGQPHSLSKFTVGTKHLTDLATQLTVVIRHAVSLLSQKFIGDEPVCNITH